MKKNLMSVIIMALVLANLILTAMLAFTIIPQTKKSNELIDQVCAAVNIELEGGSAKDLSAVPIEDIEVFNITDSFTVNLAPNGDGKKHYAIFSVGLSMNTKARAMRLTAAPQDLRRRRRSSAARSIRSSALIR